ncbi:GNAT family N-acetyltransferase [Nocardioides taihuensis]|uniref:GNAT family N-acetyltransferase n=1 Tax=Nocardioides taihuensis TaxID=1835606 RepID=A0ABW0BGK1_9ACTN
MSAGTTVDIEQIDPANRAALAAWHATVVAADTFGREENATPWQLPEVEAELAEQTDVTRLVFAGIQDGRTVVVSGQVGMPLRHSTHHADLAVYAHPDHRRRGHGTRMLAHLEEVARGHGRTVANAEAAWPYDAPADGTGTPAGEFLRSCGYKFGIGDVMRTLDLPVDDAVLDALAAEAAPHHAAYTLRSWAGRVPDELAVGWADLLADLMIEAPTGEMERQRESAGVEEMRRHEALVAAQGRTTYNTVALDADGWPVAYSNLAVTRHEPGNAFQWGTLVRPEHRGHRLGLAVKAVNLRFYQDTVRHDEERATRLRTWNAEINTHMVSVNERLGFRAVERLGEFQKGLVGA